MIVDKYNFEEIVDVLQKARTLACDCETTGLFPYKGDELFSIILASHHGPYYFNFNDVYNVSGRFMLGLEHIERLKDVFLDPNRLWFMHNAKFDLAFLSNLGLEVAGTLHDTKTVERLCYNEYQSYRLEACAERMGEKKDDTVEKYIQEHKLYTSEKLDHKKTKVKFMHYDQVPWDLITKYGEKDGEITYKLGEDQLMRIRTLSKSVFTHQVPVVATYAIETKLTRVVFNMERTGVKIDHGYCKKAITYEEGKAEEAKRRFLDLTGHPFSDSPKLFRSVFEGVDVPRTAKGNPSFDRASLEQINNDVSRAILDVRNHKKTVEYYHSFLYYSDSNGVLHTNFNADGTQTGRFSSSNPNLQNLKKEKVEPDSDVPTVRGAIVPRPGYFFAMIDYDQMEYRMMLDIAEEMSLIEKIKGGLDVHEATAQLAGITRTQAKTVNFAILYGAGIAKLAGMLSIRDEEAREIKEKIFRAAPKMRDFIRRTISDAEDFKRIVNWAGRISHFPKHELAYKAPNYLIQGGCADVIKSAMVEINEHLNRHKSRMVLTIHDEIVIEVHEDEEFLIDEVRKIMESSYPHKHLELTCSVEVSKKSLAHKVQYMGSGYHTTDTPKGSSSGRRASTDASGGEVEL